MNSRENAVSGERAYRHNGERSPEEIEEEIERTRADMDHTLDAIQRKLSPGQLLDQVIEQFRPVNDTASTYYAGVDNAVRRNPVAVTLVGVGLGWLMLGSREPQQHASARRDLDYSRTDELSPERGRGVGDSLRETVREWRQRWGETRERAGASAHDLRERWNETRDHFGETAHGWSERAGAQREHYGDMAHDLRERGGRLGRQARHQAERASSGFTNMLEEQPLVVGAVGIALGAMIAASLPHSRREDEMFGDARERLTERAARAGEERMEDVREAGERVVEKTRESAEQAMERAHESGERHMEEAQRETRSGSGEAGAGQSTSAVGTSPGSKPGEPRT